MTRRGLLSGLLCVPLVDVYPSSSPRAVFGPKPTSYDTVYDRLMPHREVIDLRFCPACRYGVCMPADKFCRECGNSLPPDPQWTTFHCGEVYRITGLDKVFCGRCGLALEESR